MDSPGSGFPFPTLGDLPDPGIKPMSLASSALQVDSLTTESPLIEYCIINICTEFGLACFSGFMLTTVSSVQNKFGLLGLHQLMINGFWCDSPGRKSEILLGHVYALHCHD